MKQRGNDIKATDFGDPGHASKIADPSLRLSPGRAGQFWEEKQGFEGGTTGLAPYPTVPSSRHEKYRSTQHRMPKPTTDPEQAALVVRIKHRLQAAPRESDKDRKPKLTFPIHHGGGRRR